MRASLILMLGLFCNFFGTYIIALYVKSNNIIDFSPFLPTGYEYSSIVETIAVYIILLVFYISIRKTVNRKISKHYKVVHYKGYYFYLITFIVIILSILAFLNINWSFSTIGRGAGQFDRGIISALSRLNLLTFPLIVFYVLAFGRFKEAKVVSAMFILLTVLSELSGGDRRIIFSYLVMIVFLILRTDTGSLFKIIFSKKIIYLSVGAVTIILSYVVRAVGTVKADYLMYGLLNSSVGALGVSNILPYVKLYISDSTGFLYGETFVNYILGVFVPSFMLYAFGGDEFYLRSSYLFNDLFNTNENMGYDFMMIADFFWNFGYIGYLVYTIMALFIIYFVVKNEKNESDYIFGITIILSVYFIAGQRSDFGLFLKSFIYCSIFYTLLFYLSPKIKLEKDNPTEND